MHATGKDLGREGGWRSGGPVLSLQTEAKVLPPDQEALDIYANHAVNSSQRARITDLSKTESVGVGESENGTGARFAVDMVVYEIHVRDFTIAANSGVEHKGKYLGSRSGHTFAGDTAIRRGWTV